MAFAVVCKSCQSRFLLNDDLLKRRVAGRVVTVRCRQCHAAIEIDASQVDAAAPAAADASGGEPAAAKVEPVETVAAKPLAFKAAPHPPRPTKSSTLMGIGAPPRPPGSTELVALSPGLLNVGHDAKPSALDFPEPPPPPSLEELNADEWEIAETPPVPSADRTPESVDDFIEELPPSIPPPAPADEEPTALMRPTSPADEEPTALIPVKDLLAAQAASSDAPPSTKRAENPAELPLDISSAAPDVEVDTEEPAKPDSVALSSVDVPLENPKSTLPLYGLEESHKTPLASPPKPPAGKPRPPTPNPSPSSTPADGSLSPAALDPPRSQDRPDSERARRNVVAPSTGNVTNGAGERKRSPLSVPILGALALAAGFLIWKRSATPPPAETARPVIAAAEPASPNAEAQEPAAPPPSATAPADDVTFETARDTATPKVTPPVRRDAAAEPRSGSEPATPSKPPTPAGDAPSVAPSEPTPQPPEPATPSGPVGDFDPAAAAAALTESAAQASTCRKEGDPSGVASVVITFAPSGRVTSANISGPPFAGTPTGGCIAAALRKARVPPFEGERVTVSKTVVIQ